MSSLLQTTVVGTFVLSLLSLGCSQKEASKPRTQPDDSDRTEQVQDVAVPEDLEPAVQAVTVSKDLERAVVDVFERVELKAPPAKRNPFGLERNVELLKHRDPKERAMAASSTSEVWPASKY